MRVERTRPGCRLGGTRAVHVLSAQSGGRRLAHEGTLTLPAGGEDAPKAAPVLALSGADEGVLLVGAYGRLLSYRRDAKGGAGGTPLASLPVEAPCALTPLRWP